MPHTWCSIARRGSVRAHLGVIIRRRTVRTHRRPIARRCPVRAHLRAIIRRRTVRTHRRPIARRCPVRAHLGVIIRRRTVRTHRRPIARRCPVRAHLRAIIRRRTVRTHRRPIARRCPVRAHLRAIIRRRTVRTHRRPIARRCPVRAHLRVIIRRRTVRTGRRTVSVGRWRRVCRVGGPGRRRPADRSRIVNRLRGMGRNSLGRTIRHHRHEGPVIRMSHHGTHGMPARMMKSRNRGGHRKMTFHGDCRRHRRRSCRPNRGRCAM